MSCEPQFPDQISIGCVWDLLTSVKQGFSIEVLKKALWIAGSGIEQFEPKDNTPIFADVSLESMVEDLEELLEQPVESFSAAAPTKLSPTMKALLKGIILKLLEMW